MHLASKLLRSLTTPPTSNYGLVYIAIAVFAIWQTASIMWRYWWKAPSAIIIAAYPTPLGRWLTALQMMFDSETLVQKAYDSSQGQPFAIPMTDRWLIFVSDRKQQQELERESESILSMEDALHELAHTQEILGPYQSEPEHNGPKSESFRVMVKVLKHRVRTNIPDMSLSLRDKVRDAVAIELEKGNSMPDADGWHRMRLMPALLRIFTRVNLQAFIGAEHANQADVYDLVMLFFWSCVRAFMIINLVPDFVLLMLRPIIMGYGTARRGVYMLLSRLTLAAEQFKHSSSHQQGSSTHITSWIAEESKLQDTSETAKITLGLLFASAFQVPLITQFCIYNYCKYPQFHDRLISEVDEHEDSAFSICNDGMPCLDSFIKETARLSPGPILSAPRTVMQTYTSPQGFTVPSGNWIAVPQLAIMRDRNVWSSPLDFQAFRYVSQESNASQTRFTHPSYEFPFWGSIRHACPARFYVSMVMKMIISHFIKDYELRLENPTKAPHLTLGSTRLPNPFTTILIRKKAEM